jgi:predicted aspartyl protease
MPVTRMSVTDDSILIPATVNGENVTFVLDTGDAIGPVFTSADAQRLRLTPGAAEGVEGAGGGSEIEATTATIEFDEETYTEEPAAIDPNLEGNSLLGLPFFLAKCSFLAFSFGDDRLYMA